MKNDNVLSECHIRDIDLSHAREILGGTIHNVSCSNCGYHKFTLRIIGKTLKKKCVRCYHEDEV